MARMRPPGSTCMTSSFLLPWSVRQGDGLHRAVVLQPSQRARFGRHHELVVSRPPHRRQPGVPRNGGGSSARAWNALQVALLEEREVLAVRRETPRNNRSQRPANGQTGVS